MNEFRLRATGQVVTEQEFRAMHNMVFPNVIDAATAAKATHGADPILAAPQPVVDATQTAVRNGVVKDALGNWVHAYKVVSRFVDETAAAAYLASILTKAKDEAVAQTYLDVDAVYDLAIGRRATEYAEAEAAARAFMADQTAPVSGYVSGFAVDNPTGQVQTNEWAAQQIIGRADAFRNAQLAMRTVRFTAQRAMRAAVDTIELNDVVRDWNGFIAKTRLELGL